MDPAGQRQWSLQSSEFDPSVAVNNRAVWGDIDGFSKCEITELNEPGQLGGWNADLVSVVASVRSKSVHGVDHDLVVKIVRFFGCAQSCSIVGVHNTPHNSSVSLAVFTVPARALLVLLSR